MSAQGTRFAPSERFRAAIAAFDALHAQDPRERHWRARRGPHEQLYAERMSHWVEALDPDASEALRLAARCQHLQRWKSPRSDYPAGKAHYYRWRRALAQQHAKDATGVLREVGYDESTVATVCALVLKRGLGSDPAGEVQTLEDAICLTFLELEFDDFARQHPAEKVIGIVQKTWKKMSLPGQQQALRLELSSRAQALLARALAS